MGQRGPLRSAHSVRSDRESTASGSVVIGKVPAAPAYLDVEEKAIFRALVRDAIAAKVPVLPVDVPLFADLARLDVMIREERDRGRRARYMGRRAAIFEVCMLSGRARARMQAPAEPEKKSVTAKLLEIRRQA